MLQQSGKFVYSERYAGVLDPTDWANELHPFPAGFKKLAVKFVGALYARFPGRL
jgi:hypothetical protein